MGDLTGRRALRAVALQADVTDPAACRPLIDQVVQEPGEIAAAIALLCSPDVSSITGSTLAKDGGQL